jgi:hypothetical protein
MTFQTMETNFVQLCLCLQGPPLERREDLRELNGAAQDEFLDELPQNSVQPPPRPKHRDGQYRFPHGPRQLPGDFNGWFSQIALI